MRALALAVLVVVGLAAVVAVAWRLVSRRRDLPCPTWLGWLVEIDNPIAKNNRAAVILDRLGVAPGMAVLDGGCGPGRLTLPAAERVGERGEVVALDIQAGMLDRLRERARAAKLDNVRYLHAGAGQGKLERGRFDRALLVTVLGEIPDRSAALREIFEALKPGGVLSVTELIFDPHYQRRSVVVRLAESVGFREKKYFGTRLTYTLHLEKPEGSHGH